MQTNQNDNVTNEQTPEVNEASSSVVDELKKFKENTVPKSDYEKLKSDYRDLCNSVLDGRSTFKEESGEVVMSEEEYQTLKDKTFNGNISNLEYCTNAIKIRNEEIRRGNKDPFLPYGANISPTYEDTQAAARVADVLEQCIEYAKGDSALFTQELQRRTNDIRVRR